MPSKQEGKRRKPGSLRQTLRYRQPRKVVTFREIVGEERCAKLLKEQEAARKRQAALRASLTSEAQARLDETRWWNSTGRFQQR